MDTFERLQDWYSSMCDGDWEHDSGFKISLLDNPGWSISLRVIGTELEAISPSFWEERSNDDWISVRKVDGYLRISCGPRNLREALDRFLDAVAL